LLTKTWYSPSLPGLCQLRGTIQSQRVAEINAKTTIDNPNSELLKTNSILKIGDEKPRPNQFLSARKPKLKTMLENRYMTLRQEMEFAYALLNNQFHFYCWLLQSAQIYLYWTHFVGTSRFLKSMKNIRAKPIQKNSNSPKWDSIFHMKMMYLQPISHFNLFPVLTLFINGKKVNITCLQ
jgi:hypothetical protein